MTAYGILFLIVLVVSVAGLAVGIVGLVIAMLARRRKRRAYKAKVIQLAVQPLLRRPWWRVSADEIISVQPLEEGAEEDDVEHRAKGC
jgi:hypothetical protein